jgi:TonB family protein
MEFHKIQNAIDLLGPQKPPTGKSAEAVLPGSADTTDNSEVKTEQAQVPAPIQSPVPPGSNGGPVSDARTAKRSSLVPASPLFAAVSALDSVATAELPGLVAPKLGIAWGDFHQGTASSIWALLKPPYGRGQRGEDGQPITCPYLRDTRVERRVPMRAVVAAGLWHIAILSLPISLFTGLPHRNAAFKNVELTWSGPIDDLPLLEIPRTKPKAIQPVEAPKPVPPVPIEAFHPRQRISTDPVRPTHPRQTLINPAAPAIAPKLLPKLPNMVQFQMAGPAKPRVQITEEMLRARPREKRATAVTTAPLQNAPNLEEHIAETNLATLQSGPARPKLELKAGAAPRVAQRTQAGDVGSAPDVSATQLTSANGGPTALVALSANPAPPTPVAPPPGNLAARVAMSPEGKKAGGTGAEAAPSGEGKNSVGVSISSGAPKISAPAPRVLITRPEPKPSEEVAERTGPPDFAALPPGATPEMIFGSRKVYKMNVNMPNLNSATGSWILNFSEFRTNNRSHLESADLSGPVPLKKVDPKYPPILIADKVEGEVILYAIIRRDGSVDSIQLVRGVDKQLDANAMRALAQWQFRPASKDGAPVELEAIVHIPFRLPEQ